jgi:HEAT repeat protein
MFDAKEAAAALPALSEAMRDGESELRAAAAAAIGHLETSEAVPLLIQALHDDDGSVRASAARTLGNIGPKAEAALTELRAATNDENYWVSRAAKLAIRSIAPGPRKVYP